MAYRIGSRGEDAWDLALKADILRMAEEGPPPLGISTPLLWFQLPPLTYLRCPRNGGSLGLDLRLWSESMGLAHLQHFEPLF